MAVIQARIRREQAIRNAVLLAACEIGTVVRVKLDNGEIVERTLESAPWQLGGGDWVCRVHGISGGFCCARITPKV